MIVEWENKIASVFHIIRQNPDGSFWWWEDKLDNTSSSVQLAIVLHIITLLDEFNLSCCDTLTEIKFGLIHVLSFDQNWTISKHLDLFNFRTGCTFDWFLNQKWWKTASVIPASYWVFFITSNLLPFVLFFNTKDCLFFKAKSLLILLIKSSWLAIVKKMWKKNSF